MSRLRIHSLRPVRPASPVPAARRLGRPLAGMLLIGLASTGLAACSGDGGVSLPSGTPTVSLPSISGIPTPTGTAESPAVPEPTRTAPSGPTRTATPAPTETPTAAPAPTETPTAAPAPTRTATATATQTQTVVSTPTPTVTAPPTETATPSPEPTVVESAEAAAPAEGEEGGISPWWILLVVAVIGAGVTWWVLARSVRRREAQAALVADLESRGRWAIDHGVGELLGAVDAAATQQAWSRLNATLVDMAAGVGTLASEVPADQGAGVIALRDAVAGLQGAAESHARAALTGEPSPSTAEAVFAARDRLAGTLDQLEPPPA